MRLPRNSCTANSTARPSFTLIELLVVIFIISILVSLSIAAILKTIGVQQSSNAKTTVRRIDEARRERWNAAVDVAYKNSNNLAAIDPAGTGTWIAVSGQTPQTTIINMAGTDPSHAKRARAIYVAYYLKQQFPQSFAEVLNCNLPANKPDPRWINPLGANPAFVTKLKNLGVTANDPPLPGESSALLYMALEKGNSGSGKVSELFGSSCVKGQLFPTTNNSTIDIPIFKDEWNVPYEFYRWSTFNTDLDATLPLTSKSRNALDPDNTFMNSTAGPLAWYNLTYAPQPPPMPQLLPFGYLSPRLLFEQSCYSLRAGFAYPLTASPKDSPYAYYITPVVVSAGLNGKLGLALPGTLTPMADDGTGASNDNINSYSVKRE